MSEEANWKDYVHGVCHLCHADHHDNAGRRPHPRRRPPVRVSDDRWDGAAAWGASAAFSVVVSVNTKFTTAPASTSTLPASAQQVVKSTVTQLISQLNLSAGIMHVDDNR